MKVVVQNYDVVDRTPTYVGYVMFGIFGYCVVGTEPGNVGCWNIGVAYDIGGYGELIGYAFSGFGQSALQVLTGFLVLYPISAGFSFVACLTTLAAHRIGFGWSAVFASVALFLVTVALVFTFVLFTIFQQNIYIVAYNGLVPYARFSNATWLALVVFSLLIVGTVIVFRGWLAERRKRYNTFMYPPAVVTPETTETTTNRVSPQQEEITASASSPLPTHNTFEASSSQSAWAPR